MLLGWGEKGDTWACCPAFNFVMRRGHGDAVLAFQRERLAVQPSPLALPSCPTCRYPLFTLGVHVPNGIFSSPGFVQYVYLVRYCYSYELSELYTMMESIISEAQDQDRY